jgi:uncharacterized protein YjbI with pentapeptide repeats
MMEKHLSTEELLKRYQQGDLTIENVWVSGPPLEGVDLSGIILRNVRLHEVNLSKADLSGAYLEHVTIEFAWLQQTNMTNAILRDVTIYQSRQLRGIILEGANLQQVKFQLSTPDERLDLSNAILRYATLVNVDLRGANLFGADLVAAYLNHVDISGADLRRVLVGRTREEQVTRDAATLWQPIAVPDPSAGRTGSRRTKNQKGNTGRESAVASSNEYIVTPGTDTTWSLTEAREQVQLMLVERFGRAGRQGQPKFRADIFGAYQKRCAITGCTIEAVLEAAHIYPHCLTRNNKISNGILLRRDLHELFDRDLLKIDPVTRQVILDPSIQEAKDYCFLNGKVADPPSPLSTSSYRAWIAALEWRRDEYHKLVEGFSPDSTARLLS